LRDAGRGLCQNCAMFAGVGDIDQLCEFAIGFLLTGRGDARRLAVELTREAPERPPLEVVFVLSSAAAGIEDVLSGEESRATALDAWRVAALLGVDLHMMQVLGHPHGRCADLMTYWQTEDGFFLS
jgi:hypothetical protein